MRKLFTLPNALSFLRLFMIPVLIGQIMHYREPLFFYMIGCYFFTIFLDFLDGFLARKLGQESDIGKILDPVADKLLVLALLVSLLIKTDFPLWLAFFIIFRDLLILIASFILFRGKGEIKASQAVGKVTFALLGMLMFFYLIDLHEGLDFSIIKSFLIPLSFSFIIWSGIDYYLIFRREKLNRFRSSDS